MAPLRVVYIALQGLTLERPGVYVKSLHLAISRIPQHRQAYISQYRTSAPASRGGGWLQCVFLMLRLNHLGKGLHELAHLFERAKAQPKAAVNHGLAPHIADQYALLA